MSTAAFVAVALLLAVLIVTNARLIFYALLVVGFFFFAATYSHAEGTYLELGAGHHESFFNSTHEWENGGGVGCYARLSHEFKEWWKGVTPLVNYSHYSQCDVGPPFNDKQESSLDHFGVGIRIKLGGR